MMPVLGSKNKLVEIINFPLSFISSWQVFFEKMWKTVTEICEINEVLFLYTGQSFRSNKET